MQINEEETRLLHEQRLNEIEKQRDEQTRARAKDARAYEKKLKDPQEKLQQQQIGEQSDRLEQHKPNLNQLQKASEARSAQEKADLVEQLDKGLARQQFDLDSHAFAQVSGVEAELQTLNIANTSRHEIDQLRAANQDSNNYNDLNSRTTDSRTSYIGSDTYGGGGSGGKSIPSPSAPQLLRVPKPAKHWPARGEAERLENLRRTREHEQQLAEYYRKYRR
jgi:hypothetical protein